MVIYLSDLYLSTTNKLGYHAPPLPHSFSTLYLPSLSLLTTRSSSTPSPPPALAADLWDAMSKWGMMFAMEDMGVA